MEEGSLMTIEKHIPAPNRVPVVRVIVHGYRRQQWQVVVKLQNSCVQINHQRKMMIDLMEK